MRRDMFPERMCKELDALTDRAEAHSWEDTVRILEQDLGVEWTRFLKIDRDALLGTGCVAQVYRGRLTQTVSVK